jgi:hypothetical protein
MSTGKPRAAQPVQSREVAIEAQRQQLFRASAVIYVCRYACDSSLAGFDPFQLVDALKVVYELIDGVAGELEQFAGDEVTRPGSDV